MAIDSQLSVLAAYVAVPLGLVFALLACMQCFKKKAGFSNFNSSTNAPNRAGHVNTTFTLEISETDDDLSHSTSVTIEPLPDIPSKTKLAPSVLRPRISPAVEKTRSDSALKLIAHHQFPRSQIVYLKELGTGWFGKVIESDAEKIVSGVPRSRVVVKMMKDDAAKDEQQMFLEEVSPFRELEHANILRLLGQCTDINPMLLVLESAAYGSLKQYLRSHRQHKATLIQKNRLLQFGIDAACGLACLHRHDYLHKDLAARNCLVMGDFKVKIGDYGIAEDLYQEDYMSSGGDLLPIRWMAPETLKLEKGTWVAHNFSKESDIWSLGVLLWEIAMMGERPYDMLTDEAVLQGVIVENEIKLPEPDIGMAQKDRMYEVMQFCWLECTQRTKVDEVHGLLQQVAAKSGTAPEGDIAEFEKKWEHLMPNQRHMSMDSMDGEGAGRQASVSSTDSDILNVLSGTDSMEDLMAPEPEVTPPTAPPRAARKKVSASAVSVPVIEVTPEPSAKSSPVKPMPAVTSPLATPFLATNIKPVRAAPPRPDVALAAQKTDTPVPRALNEEAAKSPLKSPPDQKPAAVKEDAAKPPSRPHADQKTAPSIVTDLTSKTPSKPVDSPNTGSSAPKSPSASETEFTDFTSHDTADDTPSRSAVSAPGEDVFTASDISSVEGEQSQNTPQKIQSSVDVSKVTPVLSAVPRDRLVEEAFGTFTPNKPTPRDRKTSTPIAKEDDVSPFTSAVESASSSTFLTAHTSPSQVTDSYATASDTTLFSDQYKTADDSSEFSAFEEIPTLPVENTESFVILETTTIPSRPDDISKSHGSLEESEVDQLNQTPTPFTLPADENLTVTEEESFGEYTSSDMDDSVKPTSVTQLEGKTKEEDLQASGDFAALKGHGKTSTQNEFYSLMDDSFVAIPEWQSTDAPSSPGKAPDKPEMTQVDDDHFLSFGTELSSLGSLAVPQPHAEDKEIPSFATDLSSLSSLDTPSTATPQAQQQDDPFGFGQEAFVDVYEAPKALQGTNPFVSTGEPSLGDFTSFDSLSFPEVTADPDQAHSTDGPDESTNSDSQPQEPAQDTRGSGTQDLFGDFAGTDSQPEEMAGSSEDQNNPFSLTVYRDSRNQNSSQQSVEDLFGLGDLAPQAPTSSPVPTNTDMFSSDLFGLQDESSSNVNPSGNSSGSVSRDFDLLSGFSSSSQAPAASPQGGSDPFGGDGGLLQEFVGQAEAGTSKDSQDEGLATEIGSSSEKEGNKTADSSLLDFSAFESADSAIASAASDDAEKNSSATTGSNGSSLIDF